MDWTPQHQNLTKQFSDIIGATDDDVTVILDVLAVVTADLMIEKVPAFDRSEAVKGFVRRFIQAEQTISIRKLMAEG